MNADEILHRLESWSRAYPADIFPEVTPAEREWLHETRPGLLDRISAGMGRHMAEKIRGDLVAIRAALDAQAGMECVGWHSRYLDPDGNEWSSWKPTSRGPDDAPSFPNGLIWQYRRIYAGPVEGGA